MTDHHKRCCPGLVRWLEDYEARHPAHSDRRPLLERNESRLAWLVRL